MSTYFHYFIELLVYNDDVKKKLVEHKCQPNFLHSNLLKLRKWDIPLVNVAGVPLVGGPQTVVVLPSRPKFSAGKRNDFYIPQC